MYICIYIDMYILLRAQMRSDAWSDAWQNTWWQNSEQNQVALHTFAALPRRSVAITLADDQACELEMIG